MIQIFCLLTQIVNERVELKNIGKYLFYREIYLTTRKNKSILDLFKHYIGGDENRFYLNERDNIGYYRWKFIVHKNRIVYVCDLLNLKFNISLDCLKCIKNYVKITSFTIKRNHF